MNTTYFLNKACDDIFDSDRTLWVGVSTTTPTVAGGNATEPSTTGTAYSRVQITNLSAASGGVKTNSADIALPESTAKWSDSPFTNYVVYDAQTGGNLLFYGTLTPNRIVEAEGVQLIIKAGQLTLTLKNETA